MVCIHIDADAGHVSFVQPVAAARISSREVICSRQQKAPAPVKVKQEKGTMVEETGSGERMRALGPAALLYTDNCNVYAIDPGRGHPRAGRAA